MLAGDPIFLFRPSTTSPDELRREGGLHALSTALKDVNLVTHDFDVASHDADVDSAGYLGMFRRPGIAIERLLSKARDGYVYAIESARNLIDVDATLGTHAIAPENGEFVAPGAIDSTQVIGSWKVKGGQAQRFKLNPDYRWDVFGEERTDGAQPQLARFPMNSTVWTEPAYRPYAVPVERNGRPIGFAPKQDPNVTQADFYSDATAGLHAALKQDANEDFHGPMTLNAYNGTGRTKSILYADANNRVYVDYASRSYIGLPTNTRAFVYGSDGRFHFPRDWTKVLRVDHDGNLYVGPVPDDAQGRNGVFKSGYSSFSMDGCTKPKRGTSRR